MLIDLAMDTRTGRRIAWALGLSVAVHAALVIAIRAQPGGAPSLSGSWTVHARIEAQGPAASEAAAAPIESPDQVDPERPRAVATEHAKRERNPAPAAAAGETRTSAVGNGIAAKEMAQPRGMEMPFVRDPNYYAVAALDAPPRLLGPADVCYPQGAVGEVAYTLMINEQGTVDEVEVAAVSPKGLFTGAAVELCSRLKFTPGIKDGRAVRSRVRFVVGSKPS